MHNPDDGYLAGIKAFTEQTASTNAVHGITEEAAMQEAREVWPEAEGFERVPGGWTFRVGAGYSSITDEGVAATYPQGTRREAQRFMGR